MDCIAASAVLAVTLRPLCNRRFSVSIRAPAVTLRLPVDEVIVVARIASMRAVKRVMWDAMPIRTYRETLQSVVHCNASRMVMGKRKEMARTFLERISIFS
jgi:hypothetical protein